VRRWLLLEEPMARLDIGHQLAVPEIMRGRARRGGGVATVMHDLNLTALVADRTVMMAAGRVLASGAIGEVLTDRVLEAAHGCRLRVGEAPGPGVPFVLPHSARRAA